MKLKRSLLVSSLLIVVFCLSGLSLQSNEWQPAENPLMTPWVQDVNPDSPRPEYPRPQMVREEWLNLNGLWDYAITPKDASEPQDYDGKILVPFCIESALSGVKKTVGGDNQLWYRRAFEKPSDWGDRVILHFGAVDWDCTVFVNGKKVGNHRGGYTPFSFDITEHLKEGTQELIVSVWDPTDKWTQARGKQVSEPEGIWYTSVTGIWQTTWLEPVPQQSIAAVKVVPDVDTSSVRLTVSPGKPSPGLVVKVTALDGGVPAGEITGFAGQLMHLPVRSPKLWSPESPFLYDLKITLLDQDQPIDEVMSYFGFRKISMAKDARGFNQLYLNGERLFQLGPLDQGWWPDGLYTAPTEEALVYDLKVTQELGFNMLRKHVKVEPARFYYHCDKMGLLVWQDMPNGNLRRTEPNSLRIDFFDPEDAKRPKDSSDQFEAELTELIENFSHFPSIVMWVPFNEGWGQYDTGRIASMIRGLDQTRLLNATSGWTDRGIGDVEDVHEYPGPGMEPAEEGRVAVLGEFGGLGWPVEGHLWWNKRNWGYRTYFSREELNSNYQRIVGNLIGPLGYGVGAAIYTQTTDVEGEINGLMTYDRKITKYDAESLRDLHDKIYTANSVAKTLVATSEEGPQTWRYNTRRPSTNWADPAFNDRNWKQGRGTFQSGVDRAFPAGTTWTEKTICLRKRFELDAKPSTLWMQFFQNISKGEVFINGTLVHSWDEPRPTRRHYRHQDLSKHSNALRTGTNVITVFAEKSEGDRGIDVGLYTLQSP